MGADRTLSFAKILSFSKLPRLGLMYLTWFNNVTSGFASY
jgi:hypothetical protein